MFPVHELSHWKWAFLSVDNLNLYIYIINMARQKRLASRKGPICDRLILVVEVHLGLTLSQAGEKLGYANPSTLYSIKAHRCLPDVEKLLALSKLMGTGGDRPNIDWIITGVGEPMLQKQPGPKDKTRVAALVETILRQSARKREALFALLDG